MTSGRNKESNWNNRFGASSASFIERHSEDALVTSSTDRDPPLVRGFFSS